MSIFGKTLSDIGCKCLEINGKELDCEDDNYKFCPWCVDQFKEMESVDQCCLEHDDSDYENECFDCED